MNVIAAGRNPSRTTAGDLLLGTLVSTVEADATLAEAVKTMKERAVGASP